MEWLTSSRPILLHCKNIKTAYESKQLQEHDLYSGTPNTNVYLYNTRTNPVRLISTAAKEYFFDGLCIL